MDCLHCIFGITRMHELVHVSGLPNLQLPAELSPLKNVCTSSDKKTTLTVKWLLKTFLYFIYTLKSFVFNPSSLHLIAYEWVDEDDDQVRWHRDFSRSSLTSVSPEPTTAKLISTLTALQVSMMKFHKYKVWKGVKNCTERKLNTNNSTIVCILQYFVIFTKSALNTLKSKFPIHEG